MVTTPVRRPRCSASSSSVVKRYCAAARQSPRTASGPTLTIPCRAFRPVISAVIVPAESGTWASTLYVFTNATWGNRSNARKFSSPGCPRFWPSRMRAAVTVATPIPSPTNRMTLRAGPRASAALATLETTPTAARRTRCCLMHFRVRMTGPYHHGPPVASSRRTWRECRFVILPPVPEPVEGWVRVHPHIESVREFQTDAHSPQPLSSSPKDS